MPKLLAVIGALVICAGLDLLWQMRHEFRFWDMNVFRALGFGTPENVLPIKEVARRRRKAWQFFLGMGFALVLGPMLIAASVTLLFYMHL